MNLQIQQQVKVESFAASTAGEATALCGNSTDCSSHRVLTVSVVDPGDLLGTLVSPVTVLYRCL